ncbi:MAG: hypothetical protein ACON38_20320, partial [Akkermansiaceae bacterium]
RIKKSKEDQQDTEEGTTAPPEEHSPEGIIDPGFQRPIAQTENGNNQNKQASDEFPPFLPVRQSHHRDRE